VRIVYTAGVWDLLHRGHLNFLWESKKLGDILVVGVVSDAGTFAYKGVFPIQHSQHRVRSMENIGFVDVVEIQGTTDPTALLERFRPDVFTHADGDGDWTELRDRVRAMGIEYVDIPYTPGISSTALRAERKQHKQEVQHAVSA